MKKKQTGINKGLRILLMAVMVLMLAGCAKDQKQAAADSKDVVHSGQDSSEDAAVSAFSLEKTSAELTVQFLDVGQGSAALVRQGEATMLIDGGDREFSSYVVSYLQKQGITSLDYVVITHYDADHLNGIIGVLNAFTCKQILAPDYQADTKIYQSFLNVVEKKAIPVIYPAVKDTFSFADSTLTVVGPVNYQYQDSNANSLAVRLEYGESSFLVCGDSTKESEQDILALGMDVASDVFAANHHGSKDSNSDEFLAAVNPDAVVISCGKENSYGHPADRVLTAIQTAGMTMYRTDLQGVITASSDGQEITFDQEACTDYRSGRELEGKAERPAEIPQNQKEPNAGIAADTSAGYVQNQNTKKFHLPSCSSVAEMKEKNRIYTEESRENLIAAGYSPCQRCNP